MARFLIYYAKLCLAITEDYLLFKLKLGKLILGLEICLLSNFSRMARELDEPEPLSYSLSSVLINFA